MSTPRKTKGRGAYFSGLSAEETACRAYLARGARILARRYRCADGEIDLIARDEKHIIFVEVKHRRRVDKGESPVSARQWRRLERAANHYMMQQQSETGALVGHAQNMLWRFDVVLIGANGTIDIIENAHCFDTDSR